jgi:hypothetical protein
MYTYRLPNQYLEIKQCLKFDYSPASIYQYFDSKEQIINAVVKQGYQEIIKSIQINKNNFKSIEREKGPGQGLLII